MKDPGKLIVLEGSDGSGKTTQFNLLGERLKASGYDVEIFDFPRYDKSSSYFVKQYLNGKYGPAEDISPYTASLFYALDRYEAGKDIRKAIDSGKVVLINRYVGSNMAHQGAKFDDPVEQRGFFVWEDNLEFQLLSIPRPDINIFLRVPAEVSYGLIGQKDQRDYTSRVRDEHESNIDHLKKSVATYDLLCQLFPKDFLAIDCAKNGQMLSIPQVSNLIWEKLRPILPQHKPHPGHAAIVTLSAQNEPAAQAAASPDDKLSQQFKNASLLLKLSVERQLKSVEPAGFEVWSDNNYKFYTPFGLPKDVEEKYKSSMEKIAGLHRQMRQKLEAYYERALMDGSNDGLSQNISSMLLPATPLAALCSFTATLSPRAVQRVSSALLSGDSEELQWSAKQLYVAARNKWPEDFKKPLESVTNPEPINNIIAKLAGDRLSQNSSDKDDVRLLEAAPRQEFDLLAETIYPYSNLSLEEITEEVSDWTYQQKYDSLRQAAYEPALLQKIQYKFDVITDQTVLSEIVNSAVVSNLQVQSVSPRYGYEVPALLEEAGIDELFLECFDESLNLFSLLQANDRDDLTVYAALLGHKLRWQFSIDAQNMESLLKHKAGPSYDKITKNILEKISEVHPLTWDVLGEPAARPAVRGSLGKNRVKPSGRRPNKRSRSQKPRDK